MNLFDLTGKTAVVIGGNSTLGGAMAVALGGHGANVAVVGRNAEKSLEVKKRIEEAGGKAEVFSADATKT
ncbi:MAG: gluconate 5-dehydrogenase, partial [Paenibacillus sp.]|nr:gluconate 5-dehydrogenase [Paenibacillus sp.]